MEGHGHGHVEVGGKREGPSLRDTYMIVRASKQEPAVHTRYRAAYGAFVRPEDFNTVSRAKNSVSRQSAGVATGVELTLSIPPIL